MGLEAAKIGTDLVGMGVKAEKDALTVSTGSRSIIILYSSIIVYCSILTIV